MHLTFQFAHFITYSISYIHLTVLLSRLQCSSTTATTLVVCPVVPVHVLYPVTAVAPVPNLLATAVCEAGMTVDVAVKSSR